jgi:hypothetical protein
MGHCCTRNKRWEALTPGPDRSTEVITGERTEAIAAVLLVEVPTMEPSDLEVPLQKVLAVRLGMSDIECVKSPTAECDSATERPTIISVGEDNWLVFTFGRWALSE